MNFELICVITVLVCIMITASEFLMHYFLAKNLMSEKANYKDARRKLECFIRGALDAPTARCAEYEISSIASLIGTNDVYYDMASDIFDRYRGEGEDDGAVSSIEKGINGIVHPVDIFAGMLNDGSVYQKSHACRRLADLEAYDYTDKIAEYIGSRDRDLAYNAGMALAQLGNSELVAKYIISIQNDKSYSSRIVDELFGVFSGDRTKLAQLSFDNCNDYMKTTIIKAIEPFKLEAFRPVFLAGAVGNDKRLKISCVKALGAFGDERDEQLLQMAAVDNDWVIRASAVRGLSKFTTHTALETVKFAIYDKEWWVRRTAASCLISMKVPASVLEEILGGSDRFAADALKSELYRNVGL